MFGPSLAQKRTGHPQRRRGCCLLKIFPKTLTGRRTYFGGLTDMHDILQGHNHPQTLQNLMRCIQHQYIVQLITALNTFSKLKSKSGVHTSTTAPVHKVVKTDVTDQSFNRSKHILMNRIDLNRLLCSSRILSARKALQAKLFLPPKIPEMLMETLNGNVKGVEVLYLTGF